MNLPGISLYNQDRLSDENFIENFVARLDLLDVLLNGLRSTAKGGETQHEIIIGSRGMGKSSLLRRVSIGISADPLLAEHFVPLRFREEQYNVITLAAFWKNCGEALAEWCEATGRDALADKLDLAIASPEWRDAEKAATAFLKVCADLGRRPVLFLDNLDLIVDALKEPECWSLRRVLQMKNGPVVIGAATHFLMQGGERDAPFYEFFHPHVLEPLSETDLLRCMQSLADARGDSGAPVRAILAREPERLRVLYTLTGGNPRVLALIYQLLERAESSEIFADLEALLDQVTPFYKARIEEYQTSQQRAVIDAIALNWDPITSGALSQATGVEVTTISSHLNRMKKVGFVEEVETSGARAGYQLGERFLNIWYLMRHGTRRTKQRLKWLTIFLTKLFSADELGRMADEARSGSGTYKAHPHYRDAVLEAFVSVGQALERSQVAASEAGLTTALRELGTTAMADLFDRAEALVTAGRSEEAVAVYDKLLANLATSTIPDVQPVIAGMLFNKGVMLGELGRSEEEISVYDQVIERFAASAEPALLEQVAKALVNKGFRIGMLGRSEEAITVYDKVVERFAASAEPALLEQVAKALINKGFRLGVLGRGEEALTVYDQVVERFTTSTEPALLERVAKALVNMGVAFGKLGRSEEEINVYDQVVERFAARTEPALLEQVARALVNKGVTLGMLGRNEEAIIVYDQVVERFASSVESILLEQVAKALFNKGFSLGVLGRSDEEIIVYDQIVERFAASTEPALLEQVARALVNKGFTLGVLGRSDEEISVYDEIDERFATSTEPALLEETAKAMFNKGFTLGALGRSDEEITAYDKVVERFATSIEPALLEVVARALVNKGVRLAMLGRNEEAITSYDRVVESFAVSTEPVLVEAVTVALGNKGRVLLDRLGSADDAVEAFEQAVQRKAGESVVLANLAWALVAAGRAQDAGDVCARLEELEPDGRALLDAGLAIARDNPGSGFEHLQTALEAGLDPDASSFFGDLLRLLRLAEARGHGERLIEWFETSGFGERYAPVFGAFVAYVRGERFLLDLNPEVRGPARALYETLSAPRRHSTAKVETKQTRRSSGRPAKAKRKG